MLHMSCGGRGGYELQATTKKHQQQQLLLHQIRQQPSLTLTSSRTRLQQLIPAIAMLSHLLVDHSPQTRLARG